MENLLSLKPDVLESAKNFASIIRGNMKPEEIFLFGSYANGYATPNSDINIAVIFLKFNGNFLETSKQLWLYAWDINKRITPMLIEKQNDDSGFCEHILQTGIKL